MIVINAENINDAYEDGLEMLAVHYEPATSRNGEVLVCTEPVTTHYVWPTQRVLFSPQRDANPFFHLVEGIWMLAGRNDVETLAYYVPSMRNFSDDGVTFHGAYGHRWRAHFSVDQLAIVVSMLRADPGSRRAVITMWNPTVDLGIAGKDIPCNLTITVQLNARHTHLNMVVFNRSNDLILGHYGANVVHFSLLQEYLAAAIGVEVGWYEQVSANLHAYRTAWAKVYPVDGGGRQDPYDDSYISHVVVRPLVDDPITFLSECVLALHYIPSGTPSLAGYHNFTNSFFPAVLHPMTRAYYCYRTLNDIGQAMAVLETAISRVGQVDWLVNGHMWMTRRLDARMARKENIP